MTTKTKLPPPEQWALCKMDEMEVAEMIEQHIDFYSEDANGNEYSVHLPMPFVRHYVRRHDGVLPMIVAYSTMPLVLGNGALLAPEGLDRKRGIQFLIPDELRGAIPKAEDCTPERVKAAIEFLFNQWLVDVSTGATGKAVLVAAALSIIERSLLDNRPCFFVTAGRRGSGKTTAIQMLIMAVTGDPAAASAWSSNEEERRKALLSHFLFGAPYILWDNIAKGLQLSCPHIERACTSEFYSDRQLGFTKMIRTAASLIHIFTGNNIGPKGDLASRSLEIRLTADRADPENRNVKHQDALHWTRSHRGEILVALYTILLGNPQLKAKRNAPGKTRFKTWWRLVGSAVEFASKQIGHDLDFKELFRKLDSDDEDGAELADILEIMLSKWPGGFEAQEMAEVINDLQSRDEDAQTLRNFLMPGVLADRVFSAQSVTRALGKHRDGPVHSNGRTLTLLAETDKHAKKLVFKVVVSKTP